MAESRKCGYCRMAGHTMPSCPQKLMERRKVVQHNIAERRHFAQMLLDRGMGNGAMIRWSGGWPTYNCLGMVMEVENLITQPQFVRFGKVKYSKQSMQQFETPDPTRAYDRNLTYSPWAKVNFKFLDCGNLVMPSKYIAIGDVLNTFRSSQPVIEVLERSSDFPDPVWDANIRCPERLMLSPTDEYLTLKNTE